MIPSSISPAARSGAERTLFNALVLAEIAGTAFHSLLLSWHEYKPGTEADFVILNRHGVLVPEMKGGGALHGTDGYWPRGAGALGPAGPVGQQDSGKDQRRSAGG